MVENTNGNGNYAQASIPKFDGHYDHWAILMENLLRSKEYWGVVEDGFPTTSVPVMPEQRKIVEESRLKALKAKNYLFASIDRSIIETILDKDSSKAIWESMRGKFQGSTKVKRARLQTLRREFEALTMKEGEKVNEYVARALAIVNRMKIHGEKVQEQTVVEKILRSMAEKYNYVVCAIEEANNMETRSIDELQGSLLIHEQKMKMHKEEDQVLKVSDGGIGTNCCRGRANRGGRGRGRQFSYKDSIECYN